MTKNVLSLGKEEHLKSITNRLAEPEEPEKPKGLLGFMLTLFWNHWKRKYNFYKWYIFN